MAGTNLVRQLQRSVCALSLVAAPTNVVPLPEMIGRVQPGVLVVAGARKLQGSDEMEIAPASGFLLTEHGAFATSRHVLEQPPDVIFLAMTGDGRVAPVVEVLASDQGSDLAIGRLAGDGFTPLPIQLEAPAGSLVVVVSHPHRQFYFVSQGIVARHFIDRTNGTPQPVLAITADFGPGSSGAPVLNAAGAVIAVADSIALRMPQEGDPSAFNPPFVLKLCHPIGSLFALIRSP